MKFVKAMPFTEAVDKLGDKTPIGSAMLSAEWQDVPVALRERAFFSSQVESIRFLQRGRDALTDFLTSAREDLESGDTALSMASRAQFVELMRQFALKEGMGPLDEELAGGLRDITSERRLSLIFNTQVRQANDYGYYRQGMQENVLNEFPAQRFIRVVDVKQERESHVPYEGQVFLKTDPVWVKINADFGVPWGPWGWGCGHDVQDEDRDTAVELGLMKPGEQLEPEVKFFNENLRASASTLDQDLLEKLKAELGKQLVIEGDEMRWRSAEEAQPAVAAPTSVERESPVSDAVEVKVPGHAGELVNAAFAAIDQVHDDGELPAIQMRATTRSVLGYFQPRHSAAGELEADHMAVKRTGPWPGLTTVHETGHFLDLEAIGDKGEFATLSGHGGMKAVLKAAEETENIQALHTKLAETGSTELAREYRYLLKPEEIWARAYAQFVTERSGDQTLKADLARLLADAGYKQRQWSAHDFKPVSQAIEKMFGELGWL